MEKKGYRKKELETAGREFRERKMRCRKKKMKPKSWPTHP